jgi:hypothetical protein
LSIFILFPLFTYSQQTPHTGANTLTHTLHSHILDQDRTLFIALPSDYDTSTRSYPVHYVTDAPVTWNVFQSLLRLHASVDAMPEGIVVGLQSDGRETHLHAERGAEPYLAFLEQEVMPFVDSEYRTLPFRSIVGHSLGGGFALYAFLSRPDLFTLCIAGSPYPLEALTPMTGQIQIPDTLSPRRSVYSAIGTEEDVAESTFTAFRSAFLDAAPETVSGVFRIHDGETHLSNLAVTFQRGLQTVCHDWRFELPDTLNAPVDTLITAHYDRLSTRVGYTVRPGQWEVLFPAMDALAKRNDVANAIRVLRYTLDLYPQSDQAHAFLARAYLSTGQPDSARMHVETALSLNPQNPFALRIQGMLNR